jgi:hypothetical protein
LRTQPLVDVDPPDQREDRIGPHLGRQVLEVLRRYVRRVAHDGVDPSPQVDGQRFEKVALEDGHGEPQPCGVRPGELDGLGGQVRREHRGIGSLILDRERDRAGARAHVDDHGVLSVADLRERVLDEELGLGPGDEHAGPDLERDPSELFISRQVLHRRAGASLTDRAAEHPGLTRVEPRRTRVQPRAIGADHVHQQDLGRRVGALDPVPIQVGAGAP